jgi:polysaccharide pyruvyl transferase WcaK-like protein
MRATPPITGDQRLRVAFFGHFGSANPGNEATLDAIILQLRAVAPDSELNCVCSDPGAVAARDGIGATAITTRPLRIWDRRRRPVARIVMAFVALAAELHEYRRAFRAMRGLDMLIIPGTGLLTDAYGLARWGPYNLFKWVLAAKLTRARVLFVSVGAGPLDGAAGRLLVKASLALADYRSYRDDASREYLRGIGFPAARDPLFPDLVFGLPQRLLPNHSALTGHGERVVGLGLMVYAERYSTRNPDPATYSAYLAELAGFAAWLLEHGYRIRLLLGDNDTIVIRQFREALAGRIAAADQMRIVQQPIGSVEDILSEIAACDVVVATRFHNVLMAMMLNRPVIAISFHHKCSSLMQWMNLSEYCHEIHKIDINGLIAQFEALERNREQVKATLDARVGEARAALEQQYDRLFAAA